MILQNTNSLLALLVCESTLSTPQDCCLTLSGSFFLNQAVKSLS